MTARDVLNWSRGAIFKYIGTIFMEKNGGGVYVMSLGRIALAALLGEAMWQWHKLGTDIVPGLKETLFALLAYNFGTKTTGVAKDAIEAYRGTPQAPSPAAPASPAPAPAKAPPVGAVSP